MGIVNKLKAQVRAARADGKITLGEVKRLQKTAKAAPAGAARNAATVVLKKTLQLHQDQFEVPARAELSKFLGTKVNLPDPSGLNGDDVSFKWIPGGRLYVDDALDSDIQQGQLGDCYLLSALASMSRNHRDLLKGAVKSLGDGTYSVRFFQPDAQGALQPVHVRVDGQLPFKDGAVRYGRSPTQTELWVAVVEKAYAQWKGGYQAIGYGGSPGQVMTDLTGRPHTFEWTAQQGDGPESAYERYKSALAAGKMVNVATPDQDAIPAGLVRNHAYAVVGVEEFEGVKSLLVRNPWGNTEPGNDGRNDGFFRVPADAVASYFVGAWTA
ncbi:MAG: hypothetical protein RL653_204 [Pseudomonadota bacterium]